MLLPALNKARDHAKSIYCANSMKQIGTCLQLYASDYNEQFPFYGEASYSSMKYSNATSWMYLLWQGGYAQKHKRDTSSKCSKLSLSCPVFDAKSDVFGRTAYRYNWMGPNDWRTDRGGFSCAVGSFGLKQSKIRDASKLILVLELCGRHRKDVNGWEGVFNSTRFCADAVGLRTGSGSASALTQHGQNSNYSFADGHVASKRFTFIKTKYLAVNPDEIADDSFSTICTNSL